MEEEKEEKKRKKEKEREKEEKREMQTKRATVGEMQAGPERDSRRAKRAAAPGRKNAKPFSAKPLERMNE